MATTLKGKLSKAEATAEAQEKAAQEVGLLPAPEDPAVFAASPLIFDENQKLSNVTISIPYYRRGKIRYEPSPMAHLMQSLPDFQRSVQQI